MEPAAYEDLDTNKNTTLEAKLPPVADHHWLQKHSWKKTGGEANTRGWDEPHDTLAPRECVVPRLGANHVMNFTKDGLVSSGVSLQHVFLHCC